MRLRPATMLTLTPIGERSKFLNYLKKCFVKFSSIVGELALRIVEYVSWWGLGLCCVGRLGRLVCCFFLVNVVLCVRWLC